MTKTAIVILNYNGRELLRKFLPSVVKFSTSARIIVADNHSTDGSSEVLREFPGVEWIQINENLGFCGGYNFALRQVEAEYYLLLNSDVEVTEGWLEPLILLLSSNALVGAAQPKILSFQHKEAFEYAGAGGGFIDSLGYPFCRGRIFNSIEEDTSQYNDHRPVFWSSGACMIIRAGLFRELGGFDEDFFAHMEEVDLCWKLHRAGHLIYYTGESTVYHVGGGTLPKSNPRKTYLNFRNGLSLIFKHLPGRDLVWKLPLRILLDWVAAVTFLAKGSGSDCWAVVKAHVHFIASLSRDYQKRKSFNKTYATGQVYPRSIVFDYFLLGRKSFKDLKF